MTDEIDAEAEKAKADFDLIARLQGRTFRQTRVTLFTDEPTAEKLGGTDATKGALGLSESVRRWGVLGEIDELRAAGDEASLEKIPELEARAAELRELLDESAMHVTLQAIPEIAWKVIQRDSRKKFQDKQTKKVPEDRIDEYEDHNVACLIRDMVVSIETVDGIKKSVTEDEAKAFAEYLPASEYQKLRDAILEVQFRSAIDSSITDDADF